jgi:hypothetical protein
MVAVKPLIFGLSLSVIIEIGPDQSKIGSVEGYMVTVKTLIFHLSLSIIIETLFRPAPIPSTERDNLHLELKIYFSKIVLVTFIGIIRQFYK